jgi:hypothetical protein
MNRVPLLADQVRSNSVQLRRSQRLRAQVRRTVHTHLYTAIRWRSVLLREEEFGSTRLLRWYREVPHEYTLQ